jgi:hypothetical protein
MGLEEDKPEAHSLSHQASGEMVFLLPEAGNQEFRKE